MKVTLSNLESATAQQVLEQSVRHLLKQGQSCYRDGIVACAYRNQRGQACAAGCFISDEEYTPDFENETWWSLVENGRVPTAHRELIRQLQFVHDSSSPYMWEDNLRDVATQFQLQFPEDVERHPSLVPLPPVGLSPKATYTVES